MLVIITIVVGLLKLTPAMFDVTLLEEFGKEGKGGDSLSLTQSGLPDIKN